MGRGHIFPGAAGEKKILQNAGGGLNPRYYGMEARHRACKWGVKAQERQKPLRDGTAAVQHNNIITRLTEQGER